MGGAMRKTPMTFNLPAAWAILSLSMIMAGCISGEGGAADGSHGDGGTDGGSQVTVTTLGWIRAENGRMMDEYGRQWLFRGVNAKYEYLFDVLFSDGRTRNEMLGEFDEKLDPPETARLGFNFVRLCITWSGLEPTEGTFSQSYLELLDKVVSEYEKAGVYVLLDFHEDGFSKEVGEDGAPLWAILPPPAELLSGPLWPEGGLQCPCGNLDQRRISKTVMDAFQSFFTNTENIQDRFMPAWKLVAQRYGNRRGVAGFEAMNEPMVSHVTGGMQLLDDFHVKAAAALRTVNPRHAYWLEPEVVTRNWTCEAPRRAKPFPDANVVYTPHLYPHLCLGFPESHNYEDWTKNLAATFNSMIAEGNSYGAAVVLGEWSVGLVSESDFPYMDAFHTMADQRNIGLARWYWRGHSADPECGGSGTTYCYRTKDNTWAIMQPGTDHFSRPFPLAVPGRLVKNEFDRVATLAFAFEAKGGEAAPLVYIPAHRYPAGFNVLVDGKAFDVKTDGPTQRALLPWDGKAGRHEVVISPK
jgi:endoglycosylceramidase